jgi:V8-like Glu-specific endopeptidase
MQIKQRDLVIMFKLLMTTIVIATSPMMASANTASDDIEFYRHSADGNHTTFKTDHLVKPVSNIREGFVGVEKSLNIKKIFGLHLRSRIHATEQNDFRYIGQVGPGCSGTLVGPKHVLTAAHCVFDLDYQIFMPDLDFAPAKNGVAEPYGKYKWKNVYVPKGYMNEGRNDRDFALIELEKPAGIELGFASFSFNKKDDSQNKVKIRITGYPGDKKDTATAKEANTMWTVTCPSFDIDSVKGVSHKCDTWGGMSGSAIFKLDARGNYDYILGVHTWGNRIQNGGVYIDEQIYGVLDNWLNGQLDPTFGSQQSNAVKDVVNIAFQNNCNFDVKFAINYTDVATGRKMTTELIELPAGYRKFGVRTQKAVTHIYAEDNNGDSMIKADATGVSDFNIPGYGNKSFLEFDLTNHTSIVAFIPLCQAPAF